MKDGNQPIAPGSALVLSDATPIDHVAFYAATSVAAPGQVVDVTATFRIITTDQPNGVETGMRLVISDGVTSFIVGAVTLGGVPGVAIAIGQNYGGGENYAGFVPVDWLNSTTLTMRLYANLDGEIISVNGVAPLVPAIVTAASMPAATTAVPSVGFGLFADLATGTVEMNQFSAVAVSPVPEPATYALLGAGLVLIGFARRKRWISQAELGSDSTFWCARLTRKLSPPHPPG